MNVCNEASAVIFQSKFLDNTYRLRLFKTNSIGLSSGEDGGSKINLMAGCLVLLYVTGEVGDPCLSKTTRARLARFCSRIFYKTPHLSIRRSRSIATKPPPDLSGCCMSTSLSSRHIDSADEAVHAFCLHTSHDTQGPSTFDPGSFGGCTPLGIADTLPPAVNSGILSLTKHGLGVGSLSTKWMGLLWYEKQPSRPE